MIPPLQPRTRPYTNRLQVPERLQIPSIDLDSKVVAVGTKTDDKGRLLWETAAFAVGHHKGSGLPGESGNVVLSGHISSPREGNVFNKLPQVEERHRAVRLWIEIDEQRPAAPQRKRGGQVDGGRGLTHAPLLVGDGDDHSVVWRTGDGRNGV